MIGRALALVVAVAIYFVAFMVWRGTQGSINTTDVKDMSLRVHEVGW